MQETLIVLYRKVGSLREVGAISGWLFRIVNRYCLRLAMRLMACRRPSRRRRSSSAPQVPKPELRIDIARAIQSLPEHYREIVVLRDLEELTIDEIAGRLRSTRETVKARLHRARALLREYLIAED